MFTIHLRKLLFKYSPSTQSFMHFTHYMTDKVLTNVKVTEISSKILVNHPVKTDFTICWELRWGFN